MTKVLGAKKGKAKRPRTAPPKGADVSVVPEKLVLRLYITGSSPQSTRALINLKRICEKYLQGCYDLQVIDVYQNPSLAREQQILAAPTLIKILPEPLRRLIGDMSDESRVLLGLSIQPDEIGSDRMKADGKKSKR